MYSTPLEDLQTNFEARLFTLKDAFPPVKHLLETYLAPETVLSAVAVRQYP